MSTMCNTAAVDIWDYDNGNELSLDLLADEAHLGELSLERISGCMMKVNDWERRSTELVDSREQ